ncbi:MAG: CapA family protein [Paludibacteraceae bacterium]|nr:CapA family protein [Paludibacteraceae bacterium]
MVCDKGFLYPLGWLFLYVILATSCGLDNASKRAVDEQADSLCVDSIMPDTSVLVEDEPLRRLRIGAVGDLMMHDYQMEKAYRNDTDTFDFSPIFQQIQSYLDENDLLIGNLETVFAGKEKGRRADVYGYASFPYFNAPDCFAATLAEAGFDLLATANNHTMDGYPEGVTATLNLLDSLHILHHGTSRDSTERERLCIVERNGIKVGFCSYTYSLNGVFVPKNKRFMVNEFCKYDSAKVSGMCETIRRLRREGADFTVAYLHCGTEYQKQPNRYQRRMADSLHRAGCDLILMAHPHILQRMDILPADSTAPKSLVAYSLGNFLSSQVFRDSIPKDIGAILQVDIVKKKDSTFIQNVYVVPTYTYWRSNHIGVLPVVKAHDKPDEVIKLWAKDKKRIRHAYDDALRVLRGGMDSTLWSITDDRYRLEW